MAKKNKQKQRATAENKQVSQTKCGRTVAVCAQAKPSENKRPVGRPELSQSVVGKLLDAFSWGCDVTSACAFAEISRDGYYGYCKRHPDFADRCEHIRNMPNIHARRTVFNALMNGDVATAKWFLERKFKDEFATKQNVDSNNVNTGFQIVMAEGDDRL